MHSAPRIRSFALAGALATLAACTPDRAVTALDGDLTVTRSSLDGRPLDTRRLVAIRARAQGCLVVTGLSNGTVRTTAISARALPFELPALARGSWGEATGASVANARVHYVTPTGRRDSLALACLVPDGVSSASVQSTITASLGRAGRWDGVFRRLSRVQDERVTDRRVLSREAQQVRYELLRRPTSTPPATTSAAVVSSSVSGPGYLYPPTIIYAEPVPRLDEFRYQDGYVDPMDAYLSGDNLQSQYRDLGDMSGDGFGGETYDPPTEPDGEESCDPVNDPECKQPLTAADSVALRNVFDVLADTSKMSDSTQRAMCAEVATALRIALQSTNANIVRGNSSRPDAEGEGHGAMTERDGTIHIDGDVLDNAARDGAGSRAQKVLASTILHEIAHRISYTHPEFDALEAARLAPTTYSEGPFKYLNYGDPNSCVGY